MHITESELNLMGRQVSRDYLTKDASMNVSIYKLAKAQKLNSSQVARVAEAANLATNEALWSRSKKGEYVFDLADQEKIAEMINKGSGLSAPVLKAEDLPVDNIKDMLPELPKYKSEKLSQYMFKAAELERIEEEREQVSQSQIHKMITKLSAAKEQIEGALDAESVKINNAQLHLNEYCKQAALLGEDVGAIYLAGVAAFPDRKQDVAAIFKTATKYASDNGADLSYMGRTFTESNMGEVINNGSVNRKHPVVRHYKTILEGTDIYTLEGAKRAHSLIKGELEVLKRNLIRPIPYMGG
ncbi:hypothetical protein EOM57_04670 [Candidatus Saccharibacteria bacterium]|nr:hypothetical protein [Candidatus Saccharibacteria bacterium]